MAPRRAAFPITGPRISRHGAQQREFTRLYGSEPLDSVRAAKRAAEQLDPNVDRSRANAELAKREGWPRTPGPRHT